MCPFSLSPSCTGSLLLHNYFTPFLSSKLHYFTPSSLLAENPYPTPGPLPPHLGSPSLVSLSWFLLPSFFLNSWCLNFGVPKSAELSSFPYPSPPAGVAFTSQLCWHLHIGLLFLNSRLTDTPSFFISPILDIYEAFSDFQYKKFKNYTVIFPPCKSDFPFFFFCHLVD